jgi:hypothetical protein
MLVAALPCTLSALRYRRPQQVLVLLLLISNVALNQL